jgi:hypothetical protein
MSNKTEQMTAAEFKEYISGGTKKKSKYNAKPKTVDDKYFHSTAEAERYGQLKLLHKAGEITEPVTQYSFPLLGGLKYTADFVYFDCKTKLFVVEDHKGVRTSDYIIRKKLMFETHGIKIFETYKNYKK